MPTTPDYTNRWGLPKPKSTNLIAGSSNNLRFDLRSLADKTDQTFTLFGQEMGETYTASDQVRKITVTPNPESATTPGELLLISETPKVFTMFHDTQIGATPVGLSDLWGTNYTRVVEADETALGGKVLRLASSGTENRLLAFTPPVELAEPGACDMAVRWQASEINAIPRLLFWGDGSPGTENGYHSIYRTNGQLSSGLFRNGAPGTNEGVQRPFEPYEWYITRARIAYVSSQNQFRFQVKMWPANQSEPSSWDHWTSNRLDELTPEGLPGLYFRGPGEALVDWIGVSWDTGSAPIPTVH